MEALLSMFAEPIIPNEPYNHPLVTGCLLFSLKCATWIVNKLGTNLEQLGQTTRSHDCNDLFGRITERMVFLCFPSSLAVSLNAYPEKDGEILHSGGEMHQM